MKCCIPGTMAASFSLLNFGGSACSDVAAEVRIAASGAKANKRVHKVRRIFMACVLQENVASRAEGVWRATDVLAENCGSCKRCVQNFCPGAGRRMGFR